MRSVSIALTSVALLVAAEPRAWAQGSGGSWVSLDGSPEGTRASVVVDPALSTTSHTYLDVTISGFYVTTRLGPDGRTYQDIDVPGLSSTSQPGAPRLPYVRADLALVTDATATTALVPTNFDLRSLPGYMVWPAPIPGIFHEGTPPQFTRDEAIYGGTAAWPATTAAGSPRRNALGGIPAAFGTAYPVHWNPVSGLLEIAAHARFAFSHGGGLTTPMGISREQNEAAGAVFPNWGSVSSNVVVDWTRYNGVFLFVCPKAWQPNIQKLIDLKKTRGFSVSVIHVPPSGESCSQLRQTIQNWYAGTPSGADHFCLLVGGFGSTPWCLDGNGQLSDKVLSSVDGDGEPEVYLGRLYVNNSTELDVEVQKILDYETGPQVSNDGNVLLIAHHEQSQAFDFASYQNKVRNAAYAEVAPNFTTIYGTNPALGNGDIASALTGGVGVAAYIGHGDPPHWQQWTYGGVSFENTDAAALTNGMKTPLVWSIACSTADPRVNGNLAHGFMKNAQGGGVAFYGAVDQTYGDVTRVLNDSLFQAVYGRGITRQGMAYAYAEHAAIAADSLLGFDAAYKYILYGDPEMSIKRKNPDGFYLPIDLIVPINVLTPCPGVDCCPSCPAPVVDVRAVTSSGAPVPDVKIGLWKPRMGDGDQVLTNGYTAPDGWVHLAAPGLTAGTLYVGFDDGDGRGGLDSIAVTSDVSAATSPPAPPLRLVARPNVTSGVTRIVFGRTLAGAEIVEIYGVGGGLARRLAAPPGSASVTWDGRDNSGRRVGAGIYIARLRAGIASVEARIVIVR